MAKYLTEFSEIVSYLERARVSEEMSVTELSHRVGLETCAQWCHIKGGYTPNPGFVTLQRYAKALGYDLALIRRQSNEGRD